MNACKSIVVIAVTVTILLLADVAHAQRNLAVTPAQPNEQRIALVIGNASYKDAPLRNPVNDATDVASALRELGFQVMLRTNANRRQMVEAVREFGGRLKKGGVGLFYFAGHGMQSKGRNYLMPVGAAVEAEADLEFETMDASIVLAQMDEAGNRLNIVVLDACRNNPFARSFRSASRGLAQMDAATGTYLAYATAPGSIAADGDGRNGIFTKHLIASLKDADSRLEDVFKRVRVQVARETGNRQIPWESSSLTGDFYFRAHVEGFQRADRAALKADVDQARLELTYWESMKDSKNADEVNAYLQQYPNGRFVGLARARLKSLQTKPQQVASVPPLGAATPQQVVPGSLVGIAPGTKFRDCKDCPEMVLIPAGSFDMGSPNFETGHRDDEGPVHKVTITQPFALAKTHITRGQFAAFVNESNYQVVAILGCLDVSRGKLDTREGVTWRDPSYQQNDSHPVVCMHRIDAKAYTDWLSRKTGKRYRLPSEAEWEYAARAGTNTARYWGDSADQACGNANVIDNTGESRVFEGKKLEVHDCSDGYVYTSPVASFKPNAFGLYDMIGNAWQLVEDCNYRSYNGAPTDGSAWTNGTCEWRVQRGGSFASNPQVARSAVRASSGFRFNDVGFRVARSD